MLPHSTLQDSLNLYLNVFQKITGFILASRIIRPGNTNPFFRAMADIAGGHDVSFKGYEFDISELRRVMSRFDFNDSRKITRGMIAWYVFQDENQKVLSLDTRFDTEHIFPRKRRNELKDDRNFESLGNKSLLEKRINIRASDHRFTDKAKYYMSRIPDKTATSVHELLVLAGTQQDFTEHDIEQRSKTIIDAFISFIKRNQLAK